MGTMTADPPKSTAWDYHTINRDHQMTVPELRVLGDEYWECYSVIRYGSRWVYHFRKPLPPRPRLGGY